MKRQPLARKAAVQRLGGLQRESVGGLADRDAVSAGRNATASPTSTTGQGSSRAGVAAGRFRPLSVIEHPSVFARKLPFHWRLQHALIAVAMDARWRDEQGQPLQAGAGVVFDPDRSIQRETSALLPTGHVVRIGGVEMAGFGEPAQEARTHLCYTAARTSGVSAAVSEK